MDINTLKELNKAATSEDLFGVINPVEHQCSNIDEILKALSYIDKLCTLTNYYDEDDLVEKLQQIEYELHGLDDKLEGVRAAIESVRAWGNEWKDIVKELIKKDLVSLDDYGLYTK